MTETETYEERQARTLAEEVAASKALQDQGFFVGYALDIKVGDIVVKTPDSIFSSSWPQDQMVAVTRVLPTDGSYFNPDEDEMVRNTVIHFIGFDQDDVQREFTYGGTHSFHIYRGS